MAISTSAYSPKEFQVLIAEQDAFGTIEALIHDNVAMTLSDSTRAFNCRFDSTELNADEETGIYVVVWDYKCQHLGNVG